MMKKIFVLINIIIVSFTLSSCNKNKDEILYQDEILERIYFGPFAPYALSNNDIAGYLSRANNEMNILSAFSTDLENSKFYEGVIIERKVIAGYYEKDIVEKLCSIRDDVQYVLDAYFIDIDGLSIIYDIVRDLKYRNIDPCDFDVDFYSFDDGIPLRYNDRILGFVLNYYKIKLHTGKEMIVIKYCLGNVIDDNYYPRYIDPFDYEPLNYGQLIYQERYECNVMDYSEFMRNIIVKDYDMIFQLESLNGEFAGKEVELFEFFKPALSDDTPNKEFEDGCSYKYDYDKLKDLLVK